MKKNILFCSLSMLLLGNVSLAQDWAVGGNALAAPGLLGTTTNQRVSFITNNLERGRITTGGQFGFGTTAPSARLHVNSAAAEDALRIQVNGITRVLTYRNGGTAIGSNTVPPAGGLFVSGSAGIGTPTPNVKLHVDGGTDAEPGSGGFIVSGGITGLNVAIDNNEIMARNNGVPSTLFLNNDGGDLDVGSGALVVVGNNVGIGVASPTGKLHIGGNFIIDGEANGIFFDDGQSISDGNGSTLGLDIECHGNFVPDADGLHSLGSDSHTWFDVWATDITINSSDVSLKSNIQDLSYGLKEIMQLRPVSYTWIKNIDGHKRLGLIAQEVKPVLPEVVRDWQLVDDEKTGKMTVAAAQKLGLQYDAIIPVLIKAIQEQQLVIQRQKQELKSFEDRLAKLEAAANSVSSSNISANTNSHLNISLQQNQPNPFNQTTTIRYAIPQGVSAQIMVYDASGRLMKTLQATQSGQVQINAGELQPGTYQYALMVNGTVVANKTMVLLK